MNKSANTVNIETLSGLNAELAQAAQWLAIQTQEGNVVTAQSIEDRFPEQATELIQLLPAVQALCSLNASAPAAGATEILYESLSSNEPIGDFEIRRELGRGGMGVVYEAWEKSLGRLVALKVLPFAALLDTRQLKRFKNEARAAAMLNHPNIVSVHSVGCDRGIHYYAMDIVEGVSLADAIYRIHMQDEVVKQADRDGDETRPQQETKTVADLRSQFSSDRPAFFRNVAELGMQAATALEYAHQAGVVHRDIKPSNLLLDHDGTLYVADFGLARIQAGDDLTMTGDLLGTLRYMSPEQIERGQDVDGRTDVYSLGLTLFELIEGRPAFHSGTRHEITSQILERRPRFSEQSRRILPADLETIVLKAIDKDVRARYDSAGELAADLSRFLHQRPIEARKTGWLGRTRRWVTRNAALAMALATMFALLLAFAGSASTIAWKLSREAELGRATLYARDMRLAQSTLEDGDRLAVEKTLLSWVPNQHERDLRDFEWYYLWNACHHPALERTIAHRLYTWNAEFVSGDGKQLAVAWWSTHVDLWDWDNRQQTRDSGRLEHETLGIRELLYLPSQQEIITGDVDGKLVFWDIDSQTKVEEVTFDAPENNNLVRDLCVTSNGKLIAAFVGDTDNNPGTVFIWNRDEKKWVARFPSRSGPGCVSFVDDQYLVLAYRRSDEIRVISMASWEEVAKFRVDATGVNALAYSAARKTLVLGLDIRGEGGRVEYRKVSEWTKASGPFIQGARIRDIDTSSDGRHLAVVGDDGSIVFADWETKRIGRVRGAHKGVIRSVDFSPDDRFIATAGRDRLVRVWNKDKLFSKDDLAKVRVGSPMDRQNRLYGFVDGNERIAGVTTGVPAIWNARTGAKQQTLDITWNGSNRHLAFNQNKSLVAMTCGYWPPQDDLKARIVIWDLEKDSLHSEYIPTLTISATVATFSLDGRYLAVGGMGKTIGLVDTQAGSYRELMIPGYVKSLDFSPDGSRLACGDVATGEIHLFDVEANFAKQPSIIVDDQGCTSCAFAPDGKTIASAGWVERKLEFYDLASGRLITQFGECPSYVVSINYSPNGKRIVAASADGETCVYDVETGEHVLVFEYDDGYPFAQFSRNGQSLLVGDNILGHVFHAAPKERLEKLSVMDLNEISCRALAGFGTEND